MLRILGLVLSLILPTLIHAEGRTMIVLDASGSMWGQIEGKTKVEIARETLATVLEGIDPATELGLVVYGHRTKGDCGDIEVAVEAAAGTAGAITDFANSAKFLGKTPLSDAVELAAKSLRSTEEKATVILVTDGIETCSGDPCALGTALEESGVDFTAHVVGFGLTDDEGKAVACLAENTGGTYLPARDAASLKEALTKTVAAEPVPAPEPEPAPAPEPAKVEFNLRATVSLTEGGEPLADTDLYWELFPVSGGKVADATLVYTYADTYETAQPAGDYLLVTYLGKVRQEQNVTLTDDATTEVHFVLNAGFVMLKAARTAGGEEEADAYVEMGSGDLKEYGYGHIGAYLPAGEITLLAQQAGAETRESMTLLAGESVEKTLVVGTGVLALSALYAEGGPVVDSGDLFFEVLSPTKDIDGNRKSFAYTYGPNQLDVPAGEYVLLARLGAAEVISEPFKVAAGQRTDFEIVLNAGVAAISAPGLDVMNIFTDKKDINGNRTEVAYSYEEATNLTLPAGKYVAVVKFKDDKPDAELAFEVKAGERTEISAP